MVQPPFEAIIGMLSYEVRCVTLKLHCELRLNLELRVCTTDEIEVCQMAYSSMHDRKG